MTLAPPTHDPVAHWKGRLEDSLEHNIRLVTSKAVIALFSAEVDYRELVRIGGRFGTHYSAQGWGAALTILTSTANILPYLNPQDRPRALYQGLVHVARECSGKPPRFITDPLPTQETHLWCSEKVVPTVYRGTGCRGSGAVPLYRHSGRAAPSSHRRHALCRSLGPSVHGCRPLSGLRQQSL